MEKIAQLDAWMFWLGLFVATFIFAWFITFIQGKSKKIAAVAKEKAPSKKSMGFFSTLFLLLVFAIILLVLSVMRLYTSFSSHELVAIVECYYRTDFGENAFELVLTRVVDKKYQTPESYIIRGQDWSLGGDIVEWQSYMNFIGLKSMYRLTRLQGRYDDAEDEMTQTLTAYPLVKDEKSEFWEKLYDIAVELPIIKSAHKNFVAAHPFFGDYFEVYATPSGYTMERFPGNFKETSE